MLPNLHDWEVIEIAIDRFDHIIKIILKMPETNEQTSLFLQGVSKFYLSGMTIQNVILDLLLFEEASESDYFEHCCSILKIDSSIFLGDSKNKIIYFEPSVGAEIACCFKDYSFHDCTRRQT
jgi:hypothetical protein